MNQTLNACAQHLQLPLSQQQYALLEQYGEMVWQKKEMLNLTSVADKEEIFSRHICDGLQAAAYVAQNFPSEAQGADAGSGAGYIGLTCAVALPHCKITLIESLQRRCAFLNWAVMTLGLRNVKVLNRRLGQGGNFQFDFVTERAMGKLTDILPLCAGSLKKGGLFIAYQGETPDEPAPALLEKCAVLALERKPYTLTDGKTRFLAPFKRM